MSGSNAVNDIEPPREGVEGRSLTSGTLGLEGSMTLASAPRADSFKWTAHARVEKWDGDQADWVARKALDDFAAERPLAAHFAHYGVEPMEVVEAPGNLLTTAGLTRLTSLLTAGGGQALTNTATRLGVGNGTTAAAVGDTDLSAASGSSNRFFMTMDATYPSVSAGVLTAKATFGGSDGNFAWQEWCIDVGTPTVTSGTTVNATMVNRKVVSLGTKVSPAVWALTATITFS